MNPEYAGQNQDSGLNAKKSGVIFFKPKLLDKKHGVKYPKGCKLVWKDDNIYCSV